MPSTARIAPTCRCRRAPLVMGKCCFKSLTSRRGFFASLIDSLLLIDIEPAVHLMAFTEGTQRRVRMAADFHYLRTAGVERTARRQVDDVWRLSLDRVETLSFLSGIHTRHAFD